MRRRLVRVSASRSGFAGCHLPPDVIMVAVRWCPRSGPSYRDVEELLAGRGAEGMSGTAVPGFRGAQHAAP
jgi:transposase-like protein